MTSLLARLGATNGGTERDVLNHLQSLSALCRIVFDAVESGDLIPGCEEDGSPRPGLRVCNISIHFPDAGHMAMAHTGPTSVPYP